MVPELRKLGHECLEYRLDARLDMAERWLYYIWRKAGRPADNKPTNADALYLAGVQAIERALLFEVDGVLIFSGMFLLLNVLRMMRRAHLRTGLILSESPYDELQEAQWAAAVDVAWTNERSSVERLKARSGNPNVHYLQHAYDARVHQPGPPDPSVPAWDVVFVGSAFEERVETLSAVDWSGINLGLYGNWDMLGSRHRLRKHLRGGVVDNRYAADLYRQAAVGLNLFRTSIGWGRGAPRISHAESLNPRALELAACGVCQVSDYRAEVDEVFGSCVPTFRTPAELEQILRRVLADPVRRRGMASLARAAVAGPEFTFAARAAQVSAQLEAAWATRPVCASA